MLARAQTPSSMNPSHGHGLSTVESEDHQKEEHHFFTFLTTGQLMNIVQNF